MEDQLKVGDVVALKSGGPHMTIEEIASYKYTDKQQAKCIWFEKTKRCEGIFELETLQTEPG